MAMQRLGTSLARSLYEDSKHMNGWPLEEALQMGIDLLEVVRKLHALDIVHGDIHPGNVVLLPAQAGRSAIRLIDFGKSFFGSDATGQKAEIRDPMTYIHARFSPYSLLGNRFGFRDDLFNALHILAVLLVGREFEPYLESLVTVRGGRGLLEFKNSKYYFAIPNGRDPVEENTSMDIGTKQLIKECLSQAMALARGQHDVDAPAPVKEVIQLIQAALSIAIDN
jgi:serine/threonine protein kinase